MRIIKARLRREYIKNMPEMANMKNKYLLEELYRNGRINQGQYGELMKYDYKLYKEKKNEIKAS